MSNGLTDSAYLRRGSSVRAGVLRQDRHAVALVDDRALLGDQVHTVEHRVDEQHVVLAVGRHRLVEVVAELQLHGHPVGRPVAVVDDRHERLDALQVLGVLGHVGTRRHQLRDERDALAKLRVLIEEQVKRREAAQHVLRQVGAVDAQDQVLAAAAQQLGLELLDALVSRGTPRRLPVDRQRVGARPHPRGRPSARCPSRSRRRGPSGSGSRAGSCAGRPACESR